MKRIPITEARRIAEQFGAEAVAIFAFDGNQVGGASYGATTTDCQFIGKWLDQILDGLKAVALLMPDEPVPPPPSTDVHP